MKTDFTKMPALPWHVSHITPRRFRDEAYMVYGSDNRHVLRLPWLDLKPYDKEIAEFIVKACNAHDEMIVALRAIAQRANESGTGPFGERETIYAMHELARVALTSSTGVP